MPKKRYRINVSTTRYLKDYTSKWAELTGESESNLVEKLLHKHAIENPVPKPHPYFKN